MKNKLKTLIGVGVVAGQVLSSSVAMAAGPDINSVLMPVGEQGPEIFVKQIIPDEQKILLHYQDQGGKGGARFTNVNVAWPRNTDELRAERPALGDDYVFDFDALAMGLGYANQWWAGAHNNGNFALASGSETEVPARWPDIYALNDNPYNILYLSIQLTEGSEQKYWVGKADYSDCMRYYQPGVVCEGVIQEDLSVKYLPFLNGEAIEMVDENDGNDEIGAGDSESEGEGSSESGVEEPDTPKTPINAPVASVNPAATTQPVLLAGVGSAVIDSGSGGAVQSSQWIETSDESAEDEVVDDDEDEITVDDAAELSPTVETEVPELGGSKQDNYWPLVLGALAVAAGVLMLWWWVILPLLKRKKEEEDAQE